MCSAFIADTKSEYASYFKLVALVADKPELRGPQGKYSARAGCASGTASSHRVGGLRRRLGAAAGAFDVPQKRFRHRQCPQSGAVVALARLVLVEQGGDRAGVEQARLPQYRSKERVAQAPAQRAAEPCGEWYREALLRAVEDFLRDIWFEGRLEDVLALAAMQLEMRRQPRRPLDERVVEQRNPHFE